MFEIQLSPMLTDVDDPDIHPQDFSHLPQAGQPIRSLLVFDQHEVSLTELSLVARRFALEAQQLGGVDLIVDLPELMECDLRPPGVSLSGWRWSPS